MKNKDNKWVLWITLLTILLGFIFSFVSEILVSNLSNLVSIIVLIGIILIGIIFDTIGVAVASASETPFHSMSANRVSEGKYGIKLLRNAAQVSNFSNDVVGDICGIISGAIGIQIVINISKGHPDINMAIISLITPSLIAGATVGGKALGKTFALENDEEVIHILAKILRFLDQKLNISFFNEKE